ncbi:MAG TPA: multicopper oxidase domain-containing protein, partial [Gemmatimonadales bacterium]|nr:multicopper oxidase domain-containing protein [Gemmatimonadales bacterium]
MAWAATPELDPVIPLGQVGNGRYVLTEIALERFIVMVSAERSPRVSARAGPLVLRGSSPSLLMVPHGVTALPPQSGSDHVHESQGWTMPPMHPRVSRMPFGLERLRPAVQPFLPVGSEAALREPVPTRTYHLADGDTITLTAAKVLRRLRGKSFVMYAYDGQIPGPRLELTQGATVTVRFRNQTDLPSSIHWHGIRLDNRDDGVPGLTQPPIPPGGEFVYRVHAPDPGIFWYHPHSRGDVAQDLGLAGNIVVRGQADRVPAKRVVSVGREAYLMLDDLLMGEDGLFPYGRQAATHALMGRFGNVLLVNGDEAWRMDARPGEQVRLNLTNAASARTFNLSLDGAELRVVASDAGLFAEPRIVESAVIAPAERYVLEARFERTGTYALVNRVRAIDRVTGRFFAEIDTLGLVRVRGRPMQVGKAAVVRNDDSAATLLRRLKGKAPDR